MSIQLLNGREYCSTATAMIIGTKDLVREKFIALASAFDVDEIVISTFTDRFEDRLHSYELLAGMFELQSKGQHHLAES